MVSRKKGRLEKQKPCQDCRTLIGAGDQRPAILPWFLDVGWRPSFRVIRAPCPLRPAAGLLLDWSVGMNSNVRRPNFRPRTSCPGCESSSARTRRACEPRSKNLSRDAFARNHTQNARRWRAQQLLATNVVLLEQRLVTRLVPLLQIVE